MRKAGFKYLMIISAAAALFIALSPLIHGLHLVFSSHSHSGCNFCITGDLSCDHGSHECCNGDVKIISSPGSNHSHGHSPETCPLCRQFTQLLHNHIILQDHLVIALQDSYPEEQVSFSGDFISISFSNIIPRAPPAC